MTLELAGAISRTIGDVGTPDLVTPGADAGFPTFQGRAALTFPWFGFKPTTVGVSGHWGREQYSSDNKVDSWSLNLDVLQPICPVVTVKGEAYVGENLDDYFGGIGQGVRTGTVGGATCSKARLATGAAGSPSRSARGTPGASTWAPVSTTWKAAM